VNQGATVWASVDIGLHEREAVFPRRADANPKMIDILFNSFTCDAVSGLL
jgi:hypothetical protein